MFFHVLAQTTNVVAAQHVIACVGITATRLCIPSFIEISSGVSERQGVKIWPFPLLWLFAFTTASTIVQAVMVRYVKSFSKVNQNSPDIGCVFKHPSKTVKKMYKCYSCTTCWLVGILINKKFWRDGRT